jgi:hypothetical protein
MRPVVIRTRRDYYAALAERQVLESRDPASLSNDDKNRLALLTAAMDAFEETKGDR